MKHTRTLRMLTTAAILAGLGAVSAFGQFAATGTTTVSVTVVAEASLQVNTATTTISSSGTLFSNYTGTTNLTYKIRTTKTGGSGTVSLKITSDFAGTGGPSVGTPPTSGDALTYLCTVASPGTACTGSQTSSLSSSTSVGTFGANASSTSAGNTASVAWTLTNDPLYATGTYSAVATFTISAS